MSPTPSERVLIVEDEPSTRVGLTELVRTWGFTADSAGDGEEALQRITVFRPSIIISDLVMPRRDGLELLRALKDDGGDYTVVILTAQGTVETAVEAMKEGAYDYLTKPIEPQRLKILLDKIVERQDTLREVKVLRKQLREHGTYGKMIGSSPADAEGLSGHRAGRADVGLGADFGRIGHRQGAGGADDPSTQPARADAVCPDQLRGDPRDAARKRDFRPRERVRSPARWTGAPAASSWPITGRCFSTRSPR